MNRPDFRILEGLRGIAALMVVLNHARGHMFVGGSAYLSTHDASLWEKLLVGVFQITSLGPNAVIVFFVLSGFSIAHSVQNGGSAANFYARRVIRLVPPCLAGLALAWLAYATVREPAPFQAFIPQYWSLYQEAIFYALAPLVVAAAWRLHFVGLAALGYLAGLFLGEGGIAHNFVFQYAFYFAVGVVAYHRRDLLQRLAMSRRAFAVSCLVGLGAMMATVHSFPRVSVLVAAALSLVLICNFQHHRITNRPLELLGAMSYTLYVTHFAAIYLWILALQQLGWLQARASASLWLWTSAVPVCLAVSFAFYLAIERPATRLLARMRERRAQAMPSARPRLQ